MHDTAEHSYADEARDGEAAAIAPSASCPVPEAASEPLQRNVGLLGTEI